MDSSIDKNNYAPRKIGGSTRAVLGGRTLLRPIHLHDIPEPDAPTSPRAVERLRSLTQPMPPAPPRPIDDLVEAAQRTRDITHVDWAATRLGSHERAVAEREYLLAKGFCDGVIAARQVMGGQS